MIRFPEAASRCEDRLTQAVDMEKKVRRFEIPFTLELQDQKKRANLWGIYGKWTQIPWSTLVSIPRVHETKTSRWRHQQNVNDFFPSLKLTFLHLKMDGWKTIVSFWDGSFVGAMMLLSGRVFDPSENPLWRTDVSRTPGKIHDPTPPLGFLSPFVACICWPA